VAQEPIVIPPLSEGLVIGRIERSKGVELPQEVLIEPLGLGTPGAYVARVASRVLTPGELEELRSLDGGYRGGNKRKYGTGENSKRIDRVMTVRKGTGARYCVLKVLNTRGQYLELGKNIRLGQAEPLIGVAPEQAGVDFRCSGKKLKGGPRISSVSTRNAQELREVRQKLEQKLVHLSTKDKQALLPVIEEYLDLFCNESTGVLPTTTKGYHEIRTGDALPIKKTPYRVPFALREEMRRQLDEMLAKGVITPCASPWAAPVILVPKKSPDGIPKYRFCTDFRGLNSVTTVPVYPIPDVKANLSLMAGSRYFTLLDIENAYWNIPIREEDKDKTGFVTPFGSFRYEKMAFGLSGAPSTFQRVMDAMLVGLRDVEVLVYLDDLLLFSETIEDHVRKMRLVFERVREANFKLSVAKCTFAVPEVVYLGHVVNEEGVAPDPSKVKAIREFPRPKKVRDIRAFLGLSGYYRAFIRNYAAMSRPLTQLTKKDEKFIWTDFQQRAFDNLKAALTSESVLAHPRFDQPFILSTDASDYAISAILSQLQNGKERPISFASRMLNTAERNYSTTQKELLAVVFGTQIHRCFLYGRKFKIVTDHAALKWLITVKNHHCARLTRWVLKLSEYDFEIEHKAGKKHVNADCLSRHIASLSTEAGSRKSEDDDSGDAITRKTVFAEQQKDPYCKEIMEKIRADPGSTFFVSDDGLLYRGKNLEGGRLVVPSTLIQPIIEMHHDKVFAGHPGSKRTRDLIKLNYFWPNMDREVETYVRQCESCAKFKGGRQPTAPLGRLPETTSPFEMTSIDICGPYPETKKGNRYLLTFIDHFSRYPEAIPIPRQDAPTVARALVTEIFSRLGCPQTLTSDKGSNFMSELFQEMCKLLKVKRINSTAFNPQMQGKVEKFHLGLNQTMCHYVNKYGNDWDDFVNYALMAHRAIPHSTTRYSPFYLLYGRQMRLPMEDDLTAAKLLSRESRDNRNVIQEHVDTLADRLEEAYRVVRENNKVGRERQKKQYDRGTRLVIFQPGEMVYLRQMNRVKRGCPKFRLRWRGPYEVIRRLSDLNYLVRVSRKKELVVNVNKMKKCCVKTAPLPNGTRNIPVRDQEGNEGRDGASDEEVTSLASYDNFENDSSSVFPPPTRIGGWAQGRRQDPTWERPEVRMSAEESPGTGSETGAGYWLRSRQGESTVAPNETLTGIGGEGMDSEPAEVEPSPIELRETGNVLLQEEGTEHRPRYNLRPLPGRKI
jgi:transposase InsO family protein